MDTEPVDPCAQEEPRRTGGCAIGAKPCGAALRGERKGKCCRNPAMANGRCRMHGGSTPVGPAAPSYRTGRTSRHLPAGLLSEAADDARRRGQAALSLYDDICDLEGRLAELRNTMQTGETGSLWDDLQHLAQAAGDPDHDHAAVVERLQRLAQAATSTRQAWRDWTDATRHKADLVKVEMARQHTAQELKGTDEIWETLVRPMVMVMMRHVQDTVAARSALMTDLREIPLLRARAVETS